MTDSKTHLQLLTDNVTEQLKDTPYVLEPTKDGFTVTIDLADSKWWMPLSRNGLKDVFIFTVKADEKTMKYSINDTRKTVEWKAGPDGATLVPSFGLNLNYKSGNIVSHTRRKDIGITDAGKVAPVVDIAFSPADRKGMIVETAEGLGWKRGFSRDEKIGLYFGIAGGAFALVCVIAAVIGSIFFS